jgi:hypothetical protein
MSPDFCPAAHTAPNLLGEASTRERELQTKEGERKRDPTSK